MTTDKESLTKDECIALLKEVLLNVGWSETDSGLWEMPERDGLWSSSSDPLTLNDAIHINNAIVKLSLGSGKS